MRSRDEQPTRRIGLAVTGLLFLSAFALDACGGPAREAPGSPAPTLPTGSPPAASEVPASPLVVERSGGIAGFIDTVEIATVGTALVTRKSGETGACTPSPEALARLRALDIAAVGQAGSKTTIADGFAYSIRTATASASVADGESDPTRAELLAAAADVVSSCLASLEDANFPTE